ncbi:ABC transporter permease [Candidatus Bipolaricaulota bacterium]|nr:ABC transporter permease [Candidatus Bipolaricaulota bacterium]MBS3791544.1 ABC transporter permease [Candidatus Bipolaricaulota bacterium]
MIRRKLKDLIRGFFVVFREYRGETTGMIGLSLIISMIILALLAPSLAPETNQKWDNVDRWRDLPGGAPPFWMNYFSSTSKARHQVKNEPDSLSSESVITTLVYNYQFDSDLPPKDIIFYVKGKYTSDRPTLIASLIRPGGEKVQLATRDIQGTEGEDGYTFETRLTMFGGSQQRTKVHRFAKEYEEGSTPDPSEIDVTRTAFAKAQDGMLSRTEPLNGEYKIELLLVGPGTELTNSRAIFTGRVYGLMGTDGTGHNIARGWIWGARYGLILGLSVAAGTVIIALIFGMTSAYYGGWVDELMQRLNEIVMGIPTLPILVVVATLWGRSIWFVIFIMTLLYWRGIAKTIRARGLQIRQNTYVEAGEALGASGARIIRGHMIPQMLPYAFAEAALMVPMAIIAAAGLHVLGLGDPTVVTWGTMLSEANSAGATIRGMWWWVLLPGLGITLLGFGFISAGMAVERIVNPKMKQE